MEHHISKTKARAVIIMIALTACTTTINISNSINTEIMPAKKKEKKETKLKTIFNYDSTSRTYEKSDLPSMTIPNEAYTINELYERHAQGLLTNVERPVYYGEQDDPEDTDFTQSPDHDLTDFNDAEEKLLEMEEKIKAETEVNQEEKPEEEIKDSEPQTEPKTESGGDDL